MRLWLMIFVPLVIAYGDTLKWLWDRWTAEGSYYTHGPLLPLLAAFVIYTRRDQIAALSQRVDPRAWWLLGGGLLLYWPHEIRV